MNWMEEQNEGAEHLLNNSGRGFQAPPCVEEGQSM